MPSFYSTIITELEEGWLRRVVIGPGALANMRGCAMLAPRILAMAISFERISAIATFVTERNPPVVKHSSYTEPRQ